MIPVSRDSIPFASAIAARHVRRRFEVDTRALASLRIALGGIVLFDLLNRAGSFDLFYTAAGVYPRSAHVATHGSSGTVSVYALSDAVAFQAALFALAVTFAVAFTLGYRTRLAGSVSLLCLVSLHVRYPAVLNGGDRLLRVLLFVALLTPLGERWSIDALQRGRPARRTAASVGTAALLCQPVVVFTTNAVEKHRGEYWYAGDGLELALSDPTMTTALGTQLLEYPSLLTALNYAWVALLAGSIPLLLFAVGRLRALAAFVYLGTFAGMAATFSVGLFPLALAASVLPFLTSPFWNRLEWLSRIDRLSGFTSPLVSLAPSIGHRRSRSGLSGDRSLTTLLATAVLAWMLAFSGIDAAGLEPPEPLHSEHLDQQDWGLYAPDPSESYSWHVVVAERADGSTFDPLDDGAVSFDRPPNADAAYETFRHRRFLTAVDRSTRNAGELADRYAEWSCRRAVAVDDATRRVVVYRLHRLKPTDGGDEETRRVTVVERNCR
ncbi:MAG: HTTM domain-containing protein [Halobacteriota archaeon]|uniref:HTTM domain-containing protein n=1 Tax=Natronomonas sp. TaxID=2184060 RepID=UPI0039751A45